VATYTQDCIFRNHGSLNMYAMVRMCSCRGQSIVKQHQLVTKALEDEIPKWHGFVLDTKVS
jgi:stress-induced morphogen